MKYVLLRLVIIAGMCSTFNDVLPKKLVYFTSRSCSSCSSQEMNPLEAQRQLLILKLVFHESQKAFLKSEKKYLRQISSTRIASVSSVPLFGLWAILLGTQQQLNPTERLGAVALTMAAASGFFYLFSKGLATMKKNFAENKEAYQEFLGVLRMEVEIELEKNKLPEAQDLLDEIAQAQSYVSNIKA
ncbi:MAG TPA: hypothetical protein VHO47_03690 [Candidatus Babeliales bacterium]|nr:hypothetical protein [Candidatus Babeliales bacterium]